MTLTLICDRCGKKPRTRSGESGWIMLRVYRRGDDRPSREVDLCEACIGIVNQALAKPGRRPKNVVPMRAVQP